MRHFPAAFSLLILALPCAAQLTPQPLDGVRLQDASGGVKRLRFLPPSGKTGDAPSVTVSYGGRTDNFRKGSMSYGASGGLEVEVPVNNHGTSAVGGLVFDDHYKERQENGVWKQDRFRSGPLTIGVLQHLGRFGWGDAQGGRGVFIEPQVGAGVNPLSDATVFAGPTSDPEPYANGNQESWHLAPPTPYVSAGVRVVSSKGLALGVEAKHFQMLQNRDQVHSGNYVQVTLTATPRLTGALRKKHRAPDGQTE